MLRRLTFGPTPQLRADIERLGVPGWIESQLNPAAIDDRAADAAVARFSTLAAGNAQNADLDSDELRDELRHATILRAVLSNRQLFEVMVEFWNNHFSVHLNESYLAYLKTGDDREVARSNPFGRFSDLLAASAHSPAMLLYLDNASSNANDEQGVNLNWGRELLELHTLGISDGAQSYTEDDVLAVANVMSGWSFDYDGHEFLYRPYFHSEAPQSVLGGAWSTPGRSGEAGYDDGVSLLEFLARHPSTARHLATKLARHFVSDSPDPALVATLAGVYLANDTNIGAVLRALFASDGFRLATHAKLRRPFDLVVAQLRALDAVVEGDADSNASRSLHTLLGELGQLPFGWPAPDGYPDVAAHWASADGMLQRWEFSGRLASNSLDGIAVELTRLLPGPLPMPAGAVADALGQRLIDGALTEAERAAVLALLGTTAEGEVTAEMAERALPTAVAIVLCSPSFQLS